jgi:hypothetical protein
VVLKKSYKKTQKFDEEKEKKSFLNFKVKKILLFSAEKTRCGKTDRFCLFRRVQ